MESWAILKNNVWREEAQAQVKFFYTLDNLGCVPNAKREIIGLMSVGPLRTYMDNPFHLAMEVIGQKTASGALVPRAHKYMGT